MRFGTRLGSKYANSNSALHVVNIETEIHFYLCNLSIAKKMFCKGFVCFSVLFYIPVYTGSLIISISLKGKENFIVVAMLFYIKSDLTTTEYV
jgi:hypothetical protein